MTSVYRFHLMGSAQRIELEVEVSSLRELNELLSYHRFVEGRMVAPDEHGVLNGVLLATGRVQCVVEAG